MITSNNKTFKDVCVYLDDLYSSLSEFTKEDLRIMLLYQPSMLLQTVYNTLETVLPTVSAERYPIIQRQLIDLEIEINHHKKYIEKELIKK